MWREMRTLRKKRLYGEVYSGNYPDLQLVPFTLSYAVLLPFSQLGTKTITYAQLRSICVA